MSSTGLSTCKHFRPCLSSCPSLKVRLATRYPATPFLKSSMPLPGHPFVRLAIAAHTLPSSALYQHVETSLVVAATGAVSTDVLLALFIMSLAPFPVDSSKAPITPLRYIALAFSLGQTMGLDTAAHFNMESPWLMHESWADSLSSLLLVCTVTVHGAHRLRTVVGSHSKSLHNVV